MRAKLFIAVFQHKSRGFSTCQVTCVLGVFCLFLEGLWGETDCLLKETEERGSRAGAAN